MVPRLSLSLFFGYIYAPPGSHASKPNRGNTRWHEWKKGFNSINYTSLIGHIVTAVSAFLVLSYSFLCLFLSYSPQTWHCQGGTPPSLLSQRTTSSSSSGYCVCVSMCPFSLLRIKPTGPSSLLLLLLGTYYSPTSSIGWSDPWSPWFGSPLVKSSYTDLDRPETLSGAVWCCGDKIWVYYSLNSRFETFPILSVRSLHRQARKLQGCIEKESRNKHGKKKKKRKEEVIEERRRGAPKKEKKKAFSCMIDKCHRFFIKEPYKPWYHHHSFTIHDQFLHQINWGKKKKRHQNPIKKITAQKKDT